MLHNTFVQISDCHIDDNPHSMGVNTHLNLNRVINKLSNTKFNNLIISGDLANSGTIKSYQILKKALKKINSDIWVMPGNHDNIENLNTVFSENILDKLLLGKWEVITIDSVQENKTSGILTKKNLEKLDLDLSTSKAKYNLIILHHPIVPMNSNWDDSLSLENPEELFTLISKYPKIRAVLFGHAHQMSEFKQNNLQIISCPSTAIQFDEEERVGFNSYTLHDNGKLEYYTQWI